MQHSRFARSVIVYLITAGAFVLGLVTRTITARAEDPVLSDIPAFQWERFQVPTFGKTKGWRTRTPTGWLVYLGDSGVFVPDPDGRWQTAPETAPRAR